MCYHLYYLTSLCLFYLSVPIHFIAFTLEQCVLCIFVLRISVLQKSTFCSYGLKHVQFLLFYFVSVVFAARRIHPQAMTAILTDGHLKVIQTHCVLNIRIKQICTPSNTKCILNNFKNCYIFQLK